MASVRTELGLVKNKPADIGSTEKRVMLREMHGRPLAGAINLK